MHATKHLADVPIRGSAPNKVKAGQWRGGRVSPLDVSLLSSLDVLAFVGVESFRNLLKTFSRYLIKVTEKKQLGQKLGSFLHISSPAEHLQGLFITGSDGVLVAAPPRPPGPVILSLTGKLVLLDSGIVAFSRFDHQSKHVNNMLMFREEAFRRQMCFSSSSAPIMLLIT